MKKHSFIEIVEAVAVVISVVLALLMFFVDRNGFLYNILTQIARVVLIVVAFLPVWVVKRLMKIKDGPDPSQKWSMRKRCLFALAVVVYAVVMLITIGKSIDKIYTFILPGDVPAVIFNSLFILPFLAGAEFFLMFLFFFTRDGTILLGSAHPLPLKKRIAGFTASVAGCVLIASLCFFSFSAVTPNGVEKHFFGRVESYTWDDAKQLRLSSRYDGTLKIEVVFSDGTKQTILGATSSETDMFKQRYPDGVAQMVRECVAVLHRAGVSFDEQKKIEKKLDCDYWIEYLESLRAIYRAAE